MEEHNMRRSGIYQEKVSGIVSNTDMTCTLDDGIADICFDSDIIPRDYRGHLLKVHDSAGKTIQGFVYTDGAGGIQNVVSAKGGSTRNWAAKDGSFDNNDASGYTYEISKVLTAPTVASGSITVGNLRADLTSDNAFVAPVGVDLSAYQDGRHIFRAVDASGYVAFGFIMSTPPSGPTLASTGGPLNDGNLVTNGTFETDTSGWSSYAATLSKVDYDSKTNVLSVADNGSFTQAWQSFTVVSGGLYKDTREVQTQNIGGNGLCTVKDGNSAFTALLSGLRELTPPLSAIWQTFSFYVTTISTTVSIAAHSSGANACYYNDISFQRVTDPASTGARIVSTKGGATRAFTYQHASFNPNAACTYKILFVGA